MVKRQARRTPHDCAEPRNTESFSLSVRNDHHEQTIVAPAIIAYGFGGAGAAGGGAGAAAGGGAGGGACTTETRNFPIAC